MCVCVCEQMSMVQCVLGDSPPTAIAPVARAVSPRPVLIPLGRNFGMKNRENDSTITWVGKRPSIICTHTHTHTHTHTQRERERERERERVESCYGNKNGDVV